MSGEISAERKKLSTPCNLRMFCPSTPEHPTPHPMARTRNNIVIRGLSGKLGQLVILSDGHIRTRPDVSKRVWSERQRSRVLIRAVDDFQVAGAEVTIGSDTGLLEQGAAAVDPATGSWVYTLAGDLPRGVDIRITVTVADLPGNRTEKTVSCVF